MRGQVSVIQVVTVVLVLVAALVFLALVVGLIPGLSLAGIYQWLGVLQPTVSPEVEIARDSVNALACAANCVSSNKILACVEEVNKKSLTATQLAGFTGMSVRGFATEIVKTSFETRNTCVSACKSTCDKDNACLKVNDSTTLSTRTEVIPVAARVTHTETYYTCSCSLEKIKGGEARGAWIDCKETTHPLTPTTPTSGMHVYVNKTGKTPTESVKEAEEKCEEIFGKDCCWPESSIYGYECKFQKEIKCTVHNFRLHEPFRKIFGESIYEMPAVEAQKALKAIGNPTFLVYFNKFPEGMDAAWKKDAESWWSRVASVVMWTIPLGTGLKGIGVVLKPVGKGIEWLFVKKVGGFLIKEVKAGGKVVGKAWSATGGRLVSAAKETKAVKAAGAAGSKAVDAVGSFVSKVMVVVKKPTFALKKLIWGRLYVNKVNARIVSTIGTSEKFMQQIPREVLEKTLDDGVKALTKASVKEWSVLEKAAGKTAGWGDDMALRFNTLPSKMQKDITKDIFESEVRLAFKEGTSEVVEDLLKKDLLNLWEYLSKENQDLIFGALLKAWGVSSTAAKSAMRYAVITVPPAYLLSLLECELQKAEAKPGSMVLQKALFCSMDNLSLYDVRNTEYDYDGITFGKPFALENTESLFFLASPCHTDLTVERGSLECEEYAYSEKGVVCTGPSLGGTASHCYGYGGVFPGPERRYNQIITETVINHRKMFEYQNDKLAIITIPFQEERPEGSTDWWALNESRLKEYRLENLNLTGPCRTDRICYDFDLYKDGKFHKHINSSESIREAFYCEVVPDNHELFRFYNETGMTVLCTLKLKEWLGGGVGSGAVYFVTNSSSPSDVLGAAQPFLAEIIRLVEPTFMPRAHYLEDSPEERALDGRVDAISIGPKDIATGTFKYVYNVADYNNDGKTDIFHWSTPDYFATCRVPAVQVSVDDDSMSRYSEMDKGANQYGWNFCYPKTSAWKKFIKYTLIASTFISEGVLAAIPVGGWAASVALHAGVFAGQSIGIYAAFEVDKPWPE